MMANPFDDILRQDESRVETPVKADSPKEHVQISLSLNKRNIERVVLSSIIVVLLLLLFINPFCGNCKIDNQDKITGNAILSQDKSEISISSVEDEGNAKIVTETDDSGYKDNFAVEFKDLKYEADSAGIPVKIQELTFVMYNKWKKFTPKVVVYWYDDQSSEAIKKKERAVLQLKEIDVGRKQTVIIDEFDSSFFDPSHAKETIRVEIYDSDTLLETITKEIGNI